MNTITRHQEIPVNIDTAWRFFSSPGNLKKITPEKMGFKITSDLLDGNMYPGMIISYIVKPLLNIPMKWVTEITHVKEPHYFIDEQKAGPYKIWHHQHFFEPTTKGTKITDIVTYAVPFGIFGRMLERIFIDKEVNRIFDYREKAVMNIFGKVN